MLTKYAYERVRAEGRVGAYRRVDRALPQRLCHPARQHMPKSAATNNREHGNQPLQSREHGSRRVSSTKISTHMRPPKVKATQCTFTRLLAGQHTLMADRVDAYRSSDPGPNMCCMDASSYCVTVAPASGLHRCRRSASARRNLRVSNRHWLSDRVSTSEMLYPLTDTSR